MNCLNQAIAEQRIHQVRLLLSLNVNPEFRDRKDHNRTPFIKAACLSCQDSAYKIARILIKVGVNVNACDSNDRTALHYACEGGKCNLVKLLLNEDAIELNRQDKQGHTPLMLAAMNGHLRASRMTVLRLVKFDVDIDVRDKKGYTPLLLAIKAQNYEIANDLVRYGNACATIRDGEKFRNAMDWLKLGLVDRMKRMGVKKSEGNSGNENDPTKQNTIEIPLFTVTGSENDVTESPIKPGTPVKDVTAISGFLFEPDPYGRHSRPPSSVVSKLSLASTQISTSIDDGQGFPAKDRPSTGVSLTSFVPNPSEIIPEEGATEQKYAKPRNSAQRSRIGTGMAKKKLPSAKAQSARNKIVLANINVPFSEEEPSQFRNRNRFAFVMPPETPYTDTSRNNLQTIQQLKQILQDQRKRKVTRSSTALMRPYTAGAAPSKPTPTNVSLPTRPHTRAQGQDAPFRKLRSEKFSKRGTSPLLTKANLQHSQSMTSLNTLLTRSDVSYEPTTNYKQASAIEQAHRNLRTLFSLYTDSFLWSPPKAPDKASLLVVGAGSDKPSLSSDQTTSMSDLASIVERSSIAPSEATSHRPTTGKPGPPRARLTSGARSMRMGSASGRSLGSASSFAR
ncbi:uncharacterized protein LOC100186920 isoform X2 [Ciona intestinalis]